MKTVFADTGYWIALLDPQDTLHPKAIQCSTSLVQATVYTSEMVLSEFLNHFAKRGVFLGRAAVNFIYCFGDSYSWQHFLYWGLSDSSALSTIDHIFISWTCFSLHLPPSRV
ncbi:MAG: hypothetical protein ACPGVO_16420 [Spirulinaceae cyanobacterium]